MAASPAFVSMAGLDPTALSTSTIVLAQLASTVLRASIELVLFTVDVLLGKQVRFFSFRALHRLYLHVNSHLLKV